MQSRFSDLGYAAKKKLTRYNRFLAGTHAATPWAALEAEIKPPYPKGEVQGRPPIGLSRMLRMYVAQQWFGLSDEGMEDALCDSLAICGFVGIDLSRESAPDATTLLKFRRQLETHGLTHKIFKAINAHLAEKGLILRERTVVDATLIAAPPSTKNKAKARPGDAPDQEGLLALRHEGSHRRRCQVWAGAYAGHDDRQHERHQPAPCPATRPGAQRVW